MKATLELALALKQQGISAIPVNRDKTPALPSWKKYQDGPGTTEELEDWFSNGKGIALLSGDAQCLDVDTKHDANIWNRFLERVTGFGLLDVLNKCLIQSTQNGGKHVVFRCLAPLRNVKLAKNKIGEVTLETRGDGGYFLAAPSIGYEVEQGEFEEIPWLSQDERDDLLAIARSLTEEVPKEERNAIKATGTKVGDDYDAQADVLLPQLLIKHGWSPAGQKYWTRPGKTKGISASWDHIPGRFYVFTSSTEFEAEKIYKPFAVYAMLEHGGDFRAAATQLGREGFGDAPKKKDAIEPERKPIHDQIQEVIEQTRLEGEELKEDDRDDLWELLKERRFDPDKEPPPVRAIFSLADRVICTPGNLTTITAQVKAGKSAFVSAMISAALAHEDGDYDNLGLSGMNESSMAFLFMDTEQSPDDFWHLVNRAMRRAGIEKVPDWIHAYSVADLGPDLARKATQLLLERLSVAHNGIYAVIVDGAADLVHDVNDARESNSLVSELHGSAIKYDCPIVCVIHLNALTSKAGIAKATGHLGSRLEKKAESNLKLEKENEVTVVWSDKQRRGPISKKDGVRFSWDDNMKMHRTVDAATEVLSKSSFELRDLFEAAFSDAIGLRYSELQKKLMSNRGYAGKTCEAKISKAKKEGFIRLEQGHYYFNKIKESK